MIRDADSQGSRSHVLLYVVNVGWFFLSHRLALARAAEAAGFKVHVTAAVESPNEAADIRAAGFQFHELPWRRGGLDPIREFKSMVRLAILMRQLRPSVVHAVTAKPIILAGLLARWFRTPVFVGALTGLGYLYADRSRGRCLRYALSRLLAIACGGRGARLIIQNQHDLDQLVAECAIGRDRAVLIPGSGVNLSTFQEVPESAGISVVLLPARMLRDKGIAEYCAAARQLHDQGIACRFLLAGKLDPYNPAGFGESELRDMCERGGVEWLGHVNDMPRAYAYCTIVCLPSYREGLPKVLIEAAAVGRAIVTTDVPGCRDVVDGGKCGLIVPPRDARALAEALRRLIGDANLRHRLGRAAAVRVREHYDEQRVINRTLSLYGEATGFRK